MQNLMRSVIIGKSSIQAGPIPDELMCEELKASEYKDIILSYDFSGNNLIDADEVSQAVKDYMDGLITCEQGQAVARAWELNCDLSDWIAPAPEIPWLPIALVVGTILVFTISLRKK